MNTRFVFTTTISSAIGRATVFADEFKQFCYALQLPMNEIMTLMQAPISTRVETAVSLWISRASWRTEENFVEVLVRWGHAGVAATLGYTATFESLRAKGPLILIGEPASLQELGAFLLKKMGKSEKAMLLRRCQLMTEADAMEAVPFSEPRVDFLRLLFDRKILNETTVNLAAFQEFPEIRDIVDKFAQRRGMTIVNHLDAFGTGARTPMAPTAPLASSAMKTDPPLSLSTTANPFRLHETLLVRKPTTLRDVVTAETPIVYYRELCSKMNKSKLLKPYLQANKFWSGEIEALCAQLQDSYDKQRVGDPTDSILKQLLQHTATYANMSLDDFLASVAQLNNGGVNKIVAEWRSFVEDSHDVAVAEDLSVVDEKSKLRTNLLKHKIFKPTDVDRVIEGLYAEDITSWQMLTELDEQQLRTLGWKLGAIAKMVKVVVWSQSSTSNNDDGSMDE